jgi:hypothetical protein
MNNLWWNLPGPSAYLEKIKRDISQGKNVILLHPFGIGDELRRAVNATFSNSELLQWRSINLADQEDSDQPLTVIGNIFCSHRESYSIQKVIEKRLINGYVIWVEGFTPASWTQWQKFLFQYEHEIRSTLADSGLFCVALSAESIAGEFSEAVSLTIHRWQGVISSLDMSLFVSQLLCLKQQSTIRTKIHSSLCSELAGSDPELAQYLANLNLPALVKPKEALIAYAKNKNWSADILKEPCWENGFCDKIDDRTFIHSAALAATDGMNEIINRIWRAQVAVLFPYLEDLRLRFLPEIKKYIRLPLRTDYGEIKQYEDLEVGVIHYFIKQTNAPKILVQLFQHLKNIRHAIAHLEIVEAKAIEDLQYCVDKISSST